MSFYCNHCDSQWIITCTCPNCQIEVQSNIQVHQKEIFDKIKQIETVNMIIHCTFVIAMVYLFIKIKH
jgi:hypothetical protein